MPKMVMQTCIVTDLVMLPKKIFVCRICADLAIYISVMDFPGLWVVFIDKKKCCVLLGFQPELYALSLHWEGRTL